jgi:hypothetical protein
MTAVDAPLVYHRLRAPVENQATLFVPPLHASTALFQSNRRQRLASNVQVAGQTLADFSRLAQRELLEMALRYTGEYADIPEPPAARELALILTGHQPQLFHPGVWLKNFVASNLARQANAWAINLIIDSDTIRSAAVRVPSGTAAEPGTHSVPFDDMTDEVPFEDRPVRDFGTWATFSCRVRQSMAQMVTHPLIAEFWPLATAAARETNHLGKSLARARHQTEASWGLETLEVPLSSVAGGRCFARFAWHILQRLPDFQQIHNESLREYRRVHCLRGPMHPVPDLAAAESRLEAPFWVWNSASPLRRRLALEPTKTGWRLLDGMDGNRIMSVRRASDPEAFADQWQGLARAGWRIRPRALITTLYARSCLGDLFIHGIGGAKYDQVTDRIMARFFDIAPPGYLTATATVQLPIAARDTRADDVRRVERELRDLRWVPERYLSGTDPVAPEARRLIERKWEWIQREATASAERKQRCLAIRDLSMQLQPFVANRMHELRREHARAVAGAARTRLLRGREFAFPLFPGEFLRSLLLELSAHRS